MTSRFKSKVVVITGAAMGMGKAHAIAFAAEGAKVYVTDIEETAGQSVADEIGGSARFVKLDVSSEDDWMRLAQMIQRDDGRLDVLLNNAGMSVLRKFEDTDPAFFQKMLNINTLGTYYAVRALKPLLKAAGNASLIVVSSTASLSATGISFAYGASKAALNQMARTLSIDLAPDGIRVNAILPGMVDTPAFWEAAKDPRMVEMMMARTPLKRMAKAQEIAEVAMFLASDAGSFITGINLVVDGGMLAL
ncbi:MAG TPA: SDR family oxidoreductase [Bryobacteraceae bacterium]|nr:SDR family oxidoreductase [Bryobacteraceae bacterium]